MSLSRLDNEDIYEVVKEEIEAGYTNASIVRSLRDVYHIGTTESSIKRFRKRHGLNPSVFNEAFTQIDGDHGEASTPPTTEKILDDPDSMLRQRGLNPEEWQITQLRANSYQGPASAEHSKETGENKVTYYQTRFTVERAKPELQIMHPRTEGYVYPEPPDPKIGQHQLVVVVGDQQAPFHDPNLHELFLGWLEENQPDQGVSLGDSVDFPDISKYQLDPENTAFVNECLQSGYDIYRDYRNASLHTLWRKLIGNHDERIRNLLLSTRKTQPLYGIKRPDSPEKPGEDLLGLSHAMRLDELGIKVVDPKGKYDLTQINLSDKLAVRHGWYARSGSGSSALATLDHLGYSVIVGHTHRQSVVHQTKHEIDGKVRTLTGVEAGCMCRVEQIRDANGRLWPSYTPNPDWQQGFVTVEIWPDGFFNIDTAKYVNGSLLWRDQRYS